MLEALGGQIWIGVLLLMCSGTAGKSPISIGVLGNKPQRWALIILTQEENHMQWTWQRCKRGQP